MQCLTIFLKGEETFEQYIASCERTMQPVSAIVIVSVIIIFLIIPILLSWSSPLSFSSLSLVHTNHRGSLCTMRSLQSNCCSVHPVKDKIYNQNQRWILRTFLLRPTLSSWKYCICKPGKVERWSGCTYLITLQWSHLINTLANSDVSGNMSLYSKLYRICPY